MVDGVTEVCAVVVTYRPDRAAVSALLQAIAPQVGATVVVSNGDSTDASSDSFRGAAEVLRQQKNIGLAAAQNVGIAWAREHGFRFVLLLDQDSMPGEGMVAALLGGLSRPGEKPGVAAVGSRFQDLRDGRDAPFVRIGFPLNQKLWCEQEGQSVDCDFLISSGTLIPLAVLDDVGLMDAGLFIDNIDLEWSFRARAKGYVLHGICTATMHHRLGDSRRPLPLGLGQVVVHGPARLYYMMRNRLRLYHLPHTPNAWIAQDVPRVLVKLFLFGVLIGPRLRNLRFMLRGLWDGLRGGEGECPLR
jgi:rhamnosyltransferase